MASPPYGDVADEYEGTEMAGGDGGRQSHLGVGRGGCRWVGHKAGGVLIGRLQGHLSDEHAKRKAAQVNFGSTVVKHVAVEE